METTHFFLSSESPHISTSIKTLTAKFKLKNKKKKTKQISVPSESEDFREHFISLECKKGNYQFIESSKATKIEGLTGCERIRE